MGREYSLLSFDRYQRIETSIVKKGEYSMKIRKKLLAMLLALSLLLNMAPMAAFATSVSAPGDVKLTLTDDNYVQVTWSRPDPVTEYPIFDFEVTLYYDGVQVGQKSDLRYSPATFKEIPSSDIERYGVEVRARQATGGIGDPDDLISFHVTDWTDWSSKATAGMLDPGGSTPPEPEEVQKIDAIYLEGETWTVTPGQAPSFTTKVADQDQGKYEITLEKWEEATSSENPKYITSDETANAEIPENQRLMEFEYDKQYYYSVSIKAKDGYALDIDTWSEVYLNNDEGRSPQDIEDQVTEGAPEDCYISCTLKNVFISKAVSFDRISLKGATASVTPENMHDVLGDGTVYYDQATKTLTLKNANFTTVGDGIISQVPGLTLNLIGDSTIQAEENYDYVFSGIGAQANLTITGDGSLTISGFPYGVHSDEGVQVAIEDGVTLILQSAPAGDNQDPVAMNVKPDLSNYPNAHIMAGNTVGDAAEVTNPDGTDYHTSKYLSISPRQAEPEPEGLSIADSFPDEGFRTYISAKFDTNKDGNLSEKEIAAATSIGGLSDKDEQKNIKSLEGIGHFTALTTLDASRMALEPAPLDLSGNKTLASVLLNTQKLESLNVSGLTNLQSLALANCGLTELDLSSNTALNHLVISGNQLTSLDVSKTNLSSELETIENSVFTGNSYEITLTGNTFNLSMLPGGFDTNKASGWNGGNVTDTTLTVNSGAVEVTYTYDCGNGIKTEFKLKVSNSPTDTHQWAIVWRWDEDNHWRACLEEDCSEQTDKATHSMDSDGSCTVCGYAPGYPDLAVPTNLRWDGTVAKWDAVENAGNYRLTLYQNGKLMWAQDVKATERDFGGWLKDPGEFYFTVAPMQAGYTYSYPGPVPHWAAQSPAYINETGSEEEQPYNPTVIDDIPLTMKVPAAGQTPESPEAAANAPYQVISSSWSQHTNIGGAIITYLSPEDTFESGKCYSLSIYLRADFNYTVSENATVTYNGAEAAKTGIEPKEDGAQITAWFKVGDPVESEVIKALEFEGIPEPAEGFDVNAASITARRLILEEKRVSNPMIDYYSWDGASDWNWWYSDAYDEKGNYAFTLEMNAAEGYRFDENTTVTINGKTARIISQSDYSIKALVLFNPDNPIIINYVEINSKAWPHDKVEIQIEEDNFQINDYIHSYGDMAMFTIKEAELKISEDQGSTWRSLKSTDTHFAQRFRYGFFVTVEAREGAKFDPNMTASINGAASVQVSNGGKTAEIYRDHLRVYKNAGVSSMSGGDTIWDYDSVPIAINKPVAGASTLVQEKYAAAVVTSGSLGLKANGHWYEVPYVGSTYVLKDRPETFESGKTYMLAVDFECETSGEYSFGGPFEVEKFVNYNNIDEIINYARKEALTNDDPHFKQSYRYWFTVDGATSEPEKITEINITGPETLWTALGDRYIYSLSNEQLAKFSIDGNITLTDGTWDTYGYYDDETGRLSFALAVPSDYYFENPEKITVKYNGNETQIFSKDFGNPPYDTLSVTIRDVAPIQKPDELWVNGVQVTDENASNVLGNNTVSYNKDTRTLTLNNANLTTHLVDDAYIKDGVIDAGGDLNIVLIGENSITTPDGREYAEGIDIKNGNLTITGQGEGAKLTIDASNLNHNGIYNSGRNDNGNTTIKNCELIVTGEDHAIYSNGTLTVENSKLIAAAEDDEAIDVSDDLTITGSNVTLTAPKDEGVDSSGAITIDNSTVIVTSRKEALEVSDDILIRNSGVRAVSTGSEAADYEAILTDGSLTIEKSTVLARSTDKALSVAPILKNVDTAQGSANYDGENPETYNEAKNDGYKWFKATSAIDLPVEEFALTADENSLRGGGTVTLTSSMAAELICSDKSVEIVPVAGKENTQWTVNLSDKTAEYTFTATALEGGLTASLTVRVTRSDGGGSGSGSGSGAASTYAITVEDSGNGEVESSRTRASRGDTVTLTITPDEGYKLDTLTVTDSKGEELELTNKGGGKYTFEMPSGKVTVEAEFVPEEAEKLPFTDVPEDEWYYDAVAYAYENGWMNGTTSTTFAPGLTTSRAMIVTILHRIEGLPSIQESTAFLDVPLDAWYADAVAWAAEHWIVEGYSDTAFGPNDPITREQLAAILYRYAQYKGYDVSAKADLSKFTDVDEISGYALEPLQWANAEGLINGKGNGVLDPKGQATRAEAAAILMRFNEDVAK